MERVYGRVSRSTTECCDLLRCMSGKSHASQTSSWLPPLENWEAGGVALPYGWEAATDKDGKQYFINHLNKTTTYEDPRKDYLDEPPQPRQIDLVRDPDMGFGFVAGSEKPVIVRFVTEGGPSEEKLLPGDQILMINGEDVKKAPRDHVIQLVRSCKERVQLTVTQPPLDNSARKSAMLSAAKKQRLKSNPSRVRFAESVDINGSPSYSPSNFNSSESTTPFMPNVLKVFLENGQTKSFKYDSSTTVGDVLDSLHQKLGIKCPEHFSLVVEHVKSLRRNKLTLLDPRETLSRIAARPGAQHLRCLYRVTFVPRDAYDLLRKDSMAFEYLYLQVKPPPSWSFISFAKPRASPGSYIPHCSTRSLSTGSWCVRSPVRCSLGSLQWDDMPLSTLLPLFDHKWKWNNYAYFSDICNGYVDDSLLEYGAFNPLFGFTLSADNACSPFLWSLALVSVTCSQLEQIGALSLSPPMYVGPIQYLYPVAARKIFLFRKPTWRNVGKWVWKYRRLLQLLYQLRVLLYLLARLKSLGKWLLKLKIVAIIIRNMEFIMKHLRKLKVLGAAFLRWRLVKRLLSQLKKIMKKYLRWNVIWKLLKRLLRK